MKNVYIGPYEEGSVWYEIESQKAFYIDKKVNFDIKNPMHDLWYGLTLLCIVSIPVIQFVMVDVGLVFIYTPAFGTVALTIWVLGGIFGLLAQRVTYFIKGKKMQACTKKMFYSALKANTITKNIEVDKLVPDKKMKRMRWIVYFAYLVVFAPLIGIYLTFIQFSARPIEEGFYVIHVVSILAPFIIYQFHTQNPLDVLKAVNLYHQNKIIYHKEKEND